MKFLEYFKRLFEFLPTCQAARDRKEEMLTPTITKRSSQDTLESSPSKKTCAEKNTTPQPTGPTTLESKFMQLPGEIRQRIYQHIIAYMAHDETAGRHKYPVICLGPDDEKQECTVWDSETRIHPLVYNLNLPSHLVGRTSLDPAISSRDIRKLHHQNARYRIDDSHKWMLNNTLPYVAPRKTWYEPRDIHAQALKPSRIAGLLYCCRVIHWELIWEFHRATEFWCTEPEEFVEFCVRTITLGTTAMIQSLRLDFWLWEIAPAQFAHPGVLNNHVVPQRVASVFCLFMENNGSPREDGWIETLAAMKVSLGDIFPNLKRLFLNFCEFHPEDFRDGRYRMGGWRYSSREQRLVPGRELMFMAWVASGLAGVVSGLGKEVELRLGGVESRAVVEWMREGIVGEWDLSAERMEGLVRCVAQEEIEREILGEGREVREKRKSGRREMLWL